MLDRLRAGSGFSVMVGGVSGAHLSLRGSSREIGRAIATCRAAGAPAEKAPSTAGSAPDGTFGEPYDAVAAMMGGQDCEATESAIVRAITGAGFGIWDANLFVAEGAEDGTLKLSDRTGEDWRLPSDEEWAFVAAERFGDDATGIGDDDGSNPAARWIAAYRYRADPRERDMEPKPRGHFGVNSNGLADLSGNVWEWTDTCYARNRVDAAGRLAEATTNCGVRIIGGQHRGYMSNFLRDGKSGGCAAGMAPPDNLGFRLVRDPAPAIGVALLRRIVGPEARG